MLPDGSNSSRYREGLFGWDYKRGAVEEATSMLVLLIVSDMFILDRRVETNAFVFSNIFLYIQNSVVQYCKI